MALGKRPQDPEPFQTGDDPPSADTARPAAEGSSSTPESPEADTYSRGDAAYVSSVEDDDAAYVSSVEDDIERVRRRAFALWQRAGEPNASADHHWYEAERQVLEPVSAEAVARRTGLNLDEAQDLIDRLGSDWELIEQVAGSRRQS